MTARAVVLRPEPGNSATAERLRAAGMEPVQHPLFVVVPVAWVPPNPADYDAILLTSANAIRHGGESLAALKALPVVAVGTATAAAARAAGFTIAATGRQDARAIIAEARGFGLTRLLHLAGRDRAGSADDAITVYAAEPAPIPAGLSRNFDDMVVLLHSPRAARAFTDLVDRDGADRTRIRIAALSQAVADAAGTGWAAVETAASPDNTALVAAARHLAIDRDPRDGDKRGMSDDQAIKTPTVAPYATSQSAPRRSRAGWLVLLVLIAFVGGLTLMSYAVRQGWWTAKTEAPVAPVTFTPAPEAGVAGARPTTPAIDTAVLMSREAALAGQLSALEMRTATLANDASAAGAQAARAENILVVLAAHRALDRGQGLGYLEDQLRIRFGQRQPHAVAVIVAAAREPVTLEALRLGLDALAPSLTAGNATDDWWRSLKREIGNLVVLRRAGTPSPIPTDRLARARRLLDAGQVEAARAEVALMPGAAGATSWSKAAQNYAQARDALDSLETIAMVAPPALAAPPPVAPVTTTDSLPGAQPPVVVPTITPDSGAQVAPAVPVQ